VVPLLVQKPPILHAERHRWLRTACDLRLQRTRGDTAVAAGPSSKHPIKYIDGYYPEVMD
jgi:hypothetical protein